MRLTGLGAETSHDIDGYLSRGMLHNNIMLHVLQRFRAAALAKTLFLVHHFFNKEKSWREVTPLSTGLVAVVMASSC